ncbi:MAG TPA: Ig-like domain repeat protein [Candidatus Sulfotelmatobacter sp.]|nr:Ig-like domain repeat protein [Candidatus Sulfotelmatobacter sp.]
MKLPVCDRYTTLLSVSRKSVAALAVLLGSVAGAFAQAPLSSAAQSPSQTPPSVLAGTAKLVEHYNPNQKLRLAFALKPQHLDEERQLAAELHDKKSAKFHKFLTAEQWNARFAPSAQDEQAVAEWARSQGLTITHRYPNRLLVDAEGTAGTIEKALGITINNYAIGAKTFFSNDREPMLPADLASTVWAVQGLNNLEQERPVSKRFQAPQRPEYVPGPAVAQGPAQHGDADVSKLPAGLRKAKGLKKSGETAKVLPPMTGGAYDPTDIYSSEAYDYNALYAQGHCCNPLGNPGQTPPQTSIAIATFDSTDLSDIAGFHTQYPYLAYNVQLFDIDGTPSPVGEGTMDIEWSTAMANSFGSYVDTAKVYAYQGANYNNVTITDVYNHMLSDGYARVFSTSWACAEQMSVPGAGDCYAATMNARDSILLSMVIQGWTLVAASGDEGASATWCGAADGVFYPASDPNVVAAGGTTLSLSAGPIYNSEVGWSGGPDGCSSNDGGSTGGFSNYWATPSYQSALGFGSRAVPDIALNADWYNTPQNFFDGGALSGNGGTSIVAPEMAGFFAQENAYLLSLGNICGSGSSPCAPMGNVNYYIYRDGLYGAPHFPFYDITSGCNNNDVTTFYGLGYYCAGTGYDEVTGWGSANMLQLAWGINWYSSPAIGSPSVNFSGPTVNTWYNSNQVVSWTVTDNGGGYTPTGVAGFTQGWDSIPSDVYREPTPGSGNSFYSGPQFPNATTGWLDFVSSGVSQGCHTVHVQAWNNMGSTAGDLTYGPVCYDTIAPVTAVSLSGTLSGGIYISPVTVTLSASDSGSGVAATYYQIDGGATLTYGGPFSVPATGTHTIVFHSTDVAGNVESNKSTSFTIKSLTSTSLTASANPTTYGVSVIFTATVTPAFGGAATGTVTFRDGATTLGAIALIAGKAAYTTSTLAAGAHSITAVYGGSGNDVPSTSGALAHTVNKAATSTLITSSVNPSSFGQSVTFKATVKSSTTGTPAGTVTFKDGATNLSTVALIGGVATFNTGALSVGSHSITVSYSGNVDFLTSTSAKLTQTVKKANSTTKLTSSLNPSKKGQAVTFTATITPAFSGAPGGTVTFKDGATTLGTGAVNTVTKQAIFKTSALSVATHSITAVYGGNVDFNGSTSAVLKQVVNP